MLFLNVNFTSKERKLNTGSSLVHDMHVQVLGRRKVFEMPHKLGELLVEKHMTKQIMRKQVKENVNHEI